MKKAIAMVLSILFTVLIVTSGCSIDLLEDTPDVAMQTYDGSSGYSLILPADWVKGEETPDKVEFHDPENQIALSVSSELGGVDYYSMKEIKEQLIESMTEALFSQYEITDDKSAAKYFDVVIKGANKNNAKIAADIYAYQPYATMRHYLVIIASNEVFEEYAALIEEIKSSFTVSLNEEQYLQLMEERRTAARAETNEEETSPQIINENDIQKE